MVLRILEQGEGDGGAEARGPVGGGAQASEGRARRGAGGSGVRGARKRLVAALQQETRLSSLALDVAT